MRAHTVLDVQRPMNIHPSEIIRRTDSYIAFAFLRDFDNLKNTLVQQVDCKQVMSIMECGPQKTPAALIYYLLQFKVTDYKSLYKSDCRNKKLEKRFRRIFLLRTIVVFLKIIFSGSVLTHKYLRDGRRKTKNKGSKRNRVT